MKWFKHSAIALQDEKIEELVYEHGIEGYGVYFAIIEMIACTLTSENVSFDLKHRAKILSKKFNVSREKIVKITNCLVDIGLLQINPETENIACFGLIKQLDITTSNNPEIKKIINSPHYQKLIESNSRLDKIRLDKSRIEEIRLDKKSVPIKKSASCDMKAKMKKMPSSIKYFCKRFNHMCLKNDSFCMSLYNKIDKDKEVEFKSKGLKRGNEAFFGAVINGIKDQIDHPDSWLNAEVKQFLNKTPKWMGDV